jgi:hypothetical protein
MLGSLTNVTLERMWNEAVVAQYASLSWLLLGIEENHKKFRIADVLVKVLPGNLPNIIRSITTLAKFLVNICYVT